jgi:imidazolonepropionase-like amidohydrolase
VPKKEELLGNAGVRKIDGKGRTLMSGLGDAHTHLTWNGGDLDALGTIGVEEHTLMTAKNAKTYLDSGYTMYVFLNPVEIRTIIPCLGRWLLVSTA